MVMTITTAMTMKMTSDGDDVSNDDDDNVDHDYIDDTNNDDGDDDDNNDSNSTIRIFTALRYICYTLR